MDPKQAQKLQDEAAQATALATLAAQVVITSEAESLTTQEDLKQIKARYKALDDWQGEVLGPIKAGLKAFTDRVNPVLKAYKAAEGSLKLALSNYELEQQRKRTEAAAEAQRLFREAQEAASSASEGSDKGEASAEAVAATRALIIEAAAPSAKAAGVSFRSNWKARVTDPRALLQAILDGKIDPSYVLPNESALNAFAKTTKGQGTIPGVELFDAGTVSVRS